MQDYHQLDIWQRAMDYAIEMYKFSADLPEGERYNLTRQLRQAASSVPINIAEGSGCMPDGEFAKLLGYASRSRKEVVTSLEVCERLYKALPAQQLPTLTDEGTQISRMTRSLMYKLAPPRSSRES